MALHANAIEADADLVRRLLATQAPELADLDITPVDEFGTDHRLFRIGGDRCARMPTLQVASAQARSDAELLPRFVPHLPLEVPEPLLLGEPAEEYPFAWTIVPWIDGRALGDVLAGEPLGCEPVAAAEALAGFLGAMTGLEVRADDPRKGPDRRGGLIADHDADVREAIEACGDRIDQAATSRAWQEAVEAPPPGRTGWIHGDLLPGNLIAHDDRLRAVIGWGGTGVGDRALDLAAAWWLFDGAARDAFRRAAAASEADWARARGWGICQAVVAIPYYWDRWPAFAQASVRRLHAAVLERG